jgi:dihydroorotate dehydrogenase (NAD+) catalytic subunit
MERQGVDLSVRIGDLVVRNPIFLAPGGLGRTPRSMKRFADAGCGAVASKTLTSEPRKGNPNPKRIRRLPCGWMLNAEGGPNIGMEAFSTAMRKTRGQIKESRVIISVAGRTIEEFVALAIQAEEMGADVLDLDISCPNATNKGAIDSWQKDLSSLYDLVTTVKRNVGIPLWIKCLSAYGTLLEIVKTLEEAGVDAIVPLTSIGGMAIDIETGKPILGFEHGVGILTGPPLKWAALKTVADVCRTVKTPVIATGGCASGQDVIEFLMAGARGVQVITAFMQEGIRHVETMISQMTDLMEKKGWGRVEDLIGLSLKYLPEKPFPVWYQ